MRVLIPAYAEMTSKKMNNKDINVFIVSYNRLSYLKKLVLWLEKAGFENIHIVDNASTYPPLLEYLNSSKHKVHRLEKNYGHLTVWECGKFDSIIKNEKYIVTDCDVLPVEECHENVAEHFLKILDKYPSYAKVGFSLKIDDLPDCNLSKQAVLDWEGQFWRKKIENGLYDASIDTTFALYRPGIYPDSKKWWKSIRTDFPYIARHLPWYEDSENPSEEEIYYQNHLNNRDSFWSVNDLELLKKYNRELLEELNVVYDSRKWKLLQVIYRTCNFVFPGDIFGKRIGKKNKSPEGDLNDIKLMQKYNKQLVTELGSIKFSEGWKILRKIESIFS